MSICSVRRPISPPDFLPDVNPQTSIARNLNFTPKSGSVGLLQNLPYDLVGSITAQYVERAPKPAELFSRDRDLRHRQPEPDHRDRQVCRNRVAQGHRAAALRSDGYYTRFDNFIFRRLTGVMYDGDFNSCGAPDTELKQAVYSQRNAIFRGGEFQSQLDISQFYGGTWGIENQFDVVRATFTDGTNVPRIPPVRVGGGAFWRGANWLVRVNLLHAFAQNDVAVIAETPTAGYNLLKAEISYKTKLAQQQAPRRLGTTRTRTDADGSRAIRNGRFQRPVPQLRRQKHQS
jgi:iron complex outermembrane recepter protein